MSNIPVNFALVHPMLMRNIFDYVDEQTLLGCISCPYLIKYVPSWAKDRFALYGVPVSNDTMQWLKSLVDMENYNDRVPRWSPKNIIFAKSMNGLRERSNLLPQTIKKRGFTIKFFEDGIPLRIYGQSLNKDILDDLVFVHKKESIHYFAIDFWYNPNLMCYEKQDHTSCYTILARNRLSGRIVRVHYYG